VPTCRKNRWKERNSVNERQKYKRVGSGEEVEKGKRIHCFSSLVSASIVRSGVCVAWDLREAV
jgi:hypothetical protein